MLEPQAFTSSWPGVALGFVARRLGAESVGLVFAVREPGGEQHLEGLPELAVGGLDDA